MNRSSRRASPSQIEMHDVVYALPTVYMRDGTKAFVAMRRRSSEEYYKGKLNHIIGHINHGEDIFRAIRREIAEEYSLGEEHYKLRYIGSSYFEDKNTGIGINLKGIFEIVIDHTSYPLIRESSEAVAGSKILMDSVRMWEKVRSNQYTPVDEHVLKFLFTGALRN